MQLSIVTPTLDRHDYLARTGASILSQVGEFDVEWIVVDGGSTDGTLPWLRELAARDSRVRFISEPDQGQSDAINKGLAIATGEIVAWLNADDLYADGALATVVHAFSSNPTVQWLVGWYEVIDLADRPIRQSIARYKHRRLTGLNFSRLLWENVVPQPSVFWRRTFGEQVGLIDVSLHWTMDYDLWLRMAKFAPPLIVEHVLAKFRHHAQSKSGIANRRQFDEGYEVAKRYAEGHRSDLLWHQLNVEKIVWGYRVLRMLGR